ncbi:MAG: alpha-glucan family phosphorylase [bacterium]
MNPAGEHPLDGRRDVEHSISLLMQWLPVSLQPLARIAFNYRWSWMGAEVENLFRVVDPALWRRSAHNPRAVIESTPPSRFEELGRERSYVEHVRHVWNQIKHELEQPPMPGTFSAQSPVAYVCSEFGIHVSLPCYSGGLGVLAGDLLKAASDLALPMVGVGLMYRQGYFNQRLDLSGLQHEYWLNADFDRLPAARVTSADGKPLVVEVRIRRRVVRIQVWRVDVGRVPLYLLDTDRDDNDPIDRWITARLYVGDRHTRLAQYSVLGIGGMRVLEAIGVRPGLVHLNEGHGALSSFERLRELLAFGRDLDAALEQVRQHTVFTTHTPVEAGNEGYREDEVEPVLGDFVDEVGIPRPTFYGLGRKRPDDRAEPAGFTPLALRTSRTANGVSRRHGAVSRAMWKAIWPERALENVPIRHVTNGVHTTTWMASPMQALLDEHLGSAWRSRLADAASWERIDAIPDEAIWRVRCEMRARLIDYVREKAVTDRLARGEPPDYVEAAARVLDRDRLTIGFARRVATYKRLYLLTRFPDRALRLLDGERPIQILLAGKAHPSDHEAKDALRNIFRVKQAPMVGGRVAFLENYDLEIARRIVAGVDVWVNLPRPPLEASGTSGMKATLNGGLNLSVLDGWWAEAYDGANGWAIATPDTSPTEQDDHDATALLDLIENEVVPLFHDRDDAGIPHGWVRKVKASLKTLVPRFTAERMVRDYVDTMYLPRNPLIA